MEQSQQKSSNNMVIVLVVSAMFLAFATYLAISMVTSRPSPESGTPGAPGTAVQPPPLVINDVAIFLNKDPSKEIILVSELNPPQATPSEPQGGLPTGTAVIVGPTATQAPPPTATRDPNPVIFKPYTVVQGDSLYSIGEAQNSSIELMAKHGIDDDDLVPGTVLNLPYANPAYCPGTRAYVVRDKETVFRIAAQFNTTVEAIAALNGINPDQVEVTQVICIPL